MMDGTCLEWSVGRLGSSATRQDQSLPVCNKFVSTSRVLFQNTQIYIFLLHYICIGVCSYCGDSEAVITFPQ